MRRLLLLALCLAACGSGGPFSGTFAGTAVFSNMCGSQSTTTGPMLALTMTQSGSTVSIEGLSCTLSGTVSGTEVMITPKTCPKDSNGNTFGYTGGSLQLEGTTMIPEIFTGDTLADGTTCTGTISGRLEQDTSGAHANVTWTQ